MRSVSRLTISVPVSLWWIYSWLFVWTGKQITILLVLGIGALLVSLTQSLLIPVMPQLAASLHTSSDGVAWLLTSTLLVSAVAVPAYGRLGDLYGTPDGHIRTELDERHAKVPYSAGRLPNGHQRRASAGGPAGGSSSGGDGGSGSGSGAY
jgi:MFS family permease